MPRKVRPKGRPKGQRQRYTTVDGCLIAGCTYFDNKPNPTIPGVKRHILAVHGQAAFDLVPWFAYPLHPPEPGAGLIKALMGGDDGEEGRE